MVGTATQLEQTCMPGTSGSKMECMLPPFALMSEVGWQEDGGFPISSMSYMSNKAHGSWSQAGRALNYIDSACCKESRQQPQNHGTVWVGGYI